MRKSFTKLEIILLVGVCALLMIIAFICETEYEFCFTTGENSYTCSYQKIGDYLLGRN